MDGLNKDITVCLILEGSYPYITGGVSSWVQDLIENLPNIKFKLFTISPTKDQSLRYTLPPNVIDHEDVVLSEILDWDYKISRRKKKDIRKKIVDYLKDSNELGNYLIELIKLIPEKYNPLNDFVESKEGWQVIVENSLLHNPVYSFSDYYWTWIARFELFFNVLSHPLPEADIYHAISTGFAGIAALSAKLRYKKLMLLSEHGLYHKEREMEIRRAKFVKGNQRDMWIGMYNKISKECYRYADLTTSLFEINRQYQIELGVKPENAIVVPNGIDIERFSVSKRIHSKFNVGLVGRVVPIKDIKTFIYIARYLSTKSNDIHFYCIGPTDEDPHYYEECENLVKSFNLQDIITFTGRVNVLEYYEILDVVVLTSIREAQPLVILEAWAAKIPTVGTNVGNIPEMLNFDKRLISASKNFSGIGDSILRLKNDSKYYNELIENNYNTLINRYDKKTLHKKYNKIYKGMLKVWQE